MRPLFLVIACLSLLAWTTEAQQPAEAPQDLAASKTLRAALSSAGLDSAASAPGAPDLDRELTSSDFGVTADSFVAGYYFKDELTGASLGPLHVSRYDRSAGRWIQAPDLGDTRGSVLAVQVGDRSVVLNLHGNPSAGNLLVLDKEKLGVVSTLPGYGARILPDGSILFFGNMVHFAPIHQERLLVLDPKSRKKTEIFPGSRLSAVAAGYLRKVKGFYARIPEAKMREYAANNGPLGDFNRGINDVAEREDGKRIAFLASYDARDLGETAPSPIQTVVRCDQSGRGAWSCKERAVGASEDADGLVRAELGVKGSSR